MQATAKEAKLPSIKKGKKTFSVFPFVNGLFFLLFCLFILVPLWKVLVDSLDLTTGYGMKLWPENFGLAGYQSVFSNPTLLRPLMISVVTTVAGTFLGLFLSTVGAYVLIQWDMPGRNFFAGIMLFTMIFQGGMIPTYLVMKSLHLTNTLWVVILMPAINVYNLVLMRNFFEGIPTSLFESATLDGCSPIQIFYKIVLPLSKAALASIGLMFAVSYWNDYTNYKLYITTDQSLYNFQMKLRSIIMGSDLPAANGGAAENTVTGETACMTLPEGESAVSGRLCGCLTLRITGVTVWDAFSLLPVPAPCRARGQLCVMPDTFPLDMEDFQALRPRREGSVYDPGRRGTDRTETFQVRDYAPGDSLRQVHWKLSGKTGRLVVRDPARPVDHRLTVLVLRQTAPPPLADALMEAAASLCQALEGRSFRLAWNGPEGYESRTLGNQEQLAQALPELMKSPAQESDPPPWQEAGTVICLCCRVPPDLPENALVLRCSQQGGEPGVFIPEQMPQQIQQWIRSAQ